MEPSDEMLCAYLDGELSSEERTRLEAILAASPQAAARLEELRGADAHLKAAVPMPPAPDIDPLIRRIRSSGLRSRKVRQIGWAPAALAAGIAGLAVGLAAGERGSSIGDVAALAPRVEQSLQRLSTGERGEGVRVVSTFLARDNSVCREFVIDGAQRGGEGIACREEQRWRMAAWVATSSRAASTYVAAGGDGLLDAAIGRLDASGPLSAEREAALKQNGWRVPARD